MSNKHTHGRAGHKNVKRTEHGPAENCTHVAKGRAKYKRRLRRTARRNLGAWNSGHADCNGNGCLDCLSG